VTTHYSKVKYKSTGYRASRFKIGNTAFRNTKYTCCKLLILRSCFIKKIIFILFLIL
jgi:hypothetical protein